VEEAAAGGLGLEIQRVHFLPSILTWKTMTFVQRSEITVAAGEKNPHPLICPRCTSVIVGSGVATFVIDQVPILSSSIGPPPPPPAVALAGMSPWDLSLVD